MSDGNPSGKPPGQSNFLMELSGIKGRGRHRLEVLRREVHRRDLTCKQPEAKKDKAFQLVQAQSSRPKTPWATVGTRYRSGGLGC